MTTPSDAGDLATLLREDVTATEPTHGLDAIVPVRLGRRRLRNRRLAAGAVTAVVVTFGAAVAVPLATGNGSSGSQHGGDPATQHGFDDYDARQMPRLMDEHVRSVLERSVPDLGRARFTAWGEDGQLQPERYDEALEMSVKYGDRNHSWYVRITHSKSEAEGDLEEDCRQTLRSLDYLACDVSTTPDGHPLQTRLMALIPLGGDDGWRTATEAELGSGRPVWYQRSVRVVTSPTLVTLAAEMVRATSRAAAEEAMLVPAVDLAEIGSDPVLRIPAPEQPH